MITAIDKFFLIYILTGFCFFIYKTHNIGIAASLKIYLLQKIINILANYNTIVIAVGTILFNIFFVILAFLFKNIIRYNSWFRDKSIIKNNIKIYQ